MIPSNCNFSLTGFCFSLSETNNKLQVKWLCFKHSRVLSKTWLQFQIQKLWFRNYARRQTEFCVVIGPLNIRRIIYDLNKSTEYKCYWHWETGFSGNLKLFSFKPNSNQIKVVYLLIDCVFWYCSFFFF